MDTGYHLSSDLFERNKKNLYNGFAMAILRSGQKGGTVKLKVIRLVLKPVEETLTEK